LLVLAGLTRVPVLGRPLPGNLDLGSKCLLVAELGRRRVTEKIRVNQLLPPIFSYCDGFSRKDNQRQQGGWASVAL